MSNREKSRKYQVRFTGELLPGFAKEQVILAIAKAYNVAPEEISKWFIPGGVTLREEASAEEVAQLEGFFQAQGLRLEIVDLSIGDHATDVERPKLDESAVHEASVNDHSTATDSDTPHTRQTDHASEERSSSQEMGVADLSSHQEAEGNQDDLRRQEESGEENRNSQQQEIPQLNLNDLSKENIEKMFAQVKAMLIPPSLAGFMPARLGRRTLAFILDYLIISFLSFVVIYLLGMLNLIDTAPFQEYFTLAKGHLSVEDLMANPELQPVLEEMMSVLSIWVSLTFVLYFILLEKLYGASLGKRLFNMRVYSLRTGGLMSWNIAIFRTMLFYIGINFLTAIPIIGGILFLLTLLWATRDPLFRRTLYDLFAGTIVGSLPQEERR
ncbi:hypothetical protein GCM10007161_13720 [Ignatzschineria indica]|uniref:RDD domain-containing protein n=1 Tax=Ignatzschineria indica TaxID=472583 RepID=A0A2U2AJP9_9GAMM|nr:RDD family protein [Ignatzschineria indica]PWD83031.1 hypothetical protein DC082_06290 [Ignatzschineria indica]GGZ83441.1 hypothetical protein GCM10007161_13720 [Ignatzschineria indica]